MTPKGTDSKSRQKILVFQQGGSGEAKIKGIGRYGDDFSIDIISIDDPLPPLMDDTSDYLPGDIEADLVLDFLKHDDLSYDLALICSAKGTPVIASGKKWRIKGIHTPPT